MPDQQEVISFICPRCGTTCIQDYYAPCDNCRQWLRYLAARKSEVIKIKMQFPDVILTCEECSDDIVMSSLENKWIHVDDEFSITEKEWKYKHEARPRYIDARVTDELRGGS